MTQKEIMETFTMRLPSTVISKIKESAEKVHIPPRTLIRAWIMQRLDKEEKEATRRIEDEKKRMVAGI